MFLIGKISLKSDSNTRNGCVEVGGLNSIKDIDKYKSGLAAAYGGSASDYDIFDSLSGSDQGRIKKGDAFELSWTGNSVSGVSFALEDAKFKVDFTISAGPVDGKIASDGVDSVTIKASAFKANGTTKHSFSGAEYIGVITPIGPSLMKFTFTSGVATATLTSTLPGKYLIPAQANQITLNSKESRVVNSLNINAYL